MSLDRLYSRICLGVFVVCGFVIVYPDRMLDWLSGRTGKVYGFRHIVYIEACGVPVLCVFHWITISTTSRISEWAPLLAVGFVATFRVLAWMITELLGFGER